jgi:hypothetical protein
MHLTLEAIARLVDEEPTPAETLHLEHCDACRRELQDMRDDSAVLASLPPIQPPAGEWMAIEARLTREGLIRSNISTSSWRAGLLRIAAALIIFFLGTMAGIAWVGGSAPSSDLAAIADQQPLTIRPATDPLPAETVVAPSVRAATGAGNLTGGEVRLASELILVRDPRTPEELERLMREAEALLFQVVLRSSQSSMPPADVGDPFTRLAVLEGITTLTGTALGQAPADPVLNGYHVAALAQREATLRQIAARTTGNWF